MIFNNKFIYAVVMMLMLPVNVFAELPYSCGTLANAYGPFDYTNPEHFKNNLPIVELAHFKPQTQMLIRGKRAVVNDIDYTLRAFPNHHKALYAMARYQLKTPKPEGAVYLTMDCYFLRAIEFKRDDDVVRIVYGIYLYKLGEYNNALVKFKEGLEIKPDSANAHYNMALTYIKMNDYEEAKKHAILAYKYGHKLQGLKNMLKNAGYWD